MNIISCQEMAVSRKAVAESGCLMYVIVRAGGFRTTGLFPSRDLDSSTPTGGGMRRNSREVALSSASRDNSSSKLQGTLFLKLGSHYYREPPASAGWGSIG
jgi:hypothetical protein